MHNNISSKTCWGANYTKLCFNNWHLNELKEVGMKVFVNSFISVIKKVMAIVT